MRRSAWRWHDDGRPRRDGHPAMENPRSRANVELDGLLQLANWRRLVDANRAAKQSAHAGANRRAALSTGLGAGQLMVPLGFGKPLAHPEVVRGALGRSDGHHGGWLLITSGNRWSMRPRPWNQHAVWGQPPHRGFYGGGVRNCVEALQQWSSVIPAMRRGRAAYRMPSRARSRDSTIGTVSPYLAPTRVTKASFGITSAVEAVRITKVALWPSSAVMLP